MIMRRSFRLKSTGSSDKDKSPEKKVTSDRSPPGSASPPGSPSSRSHPKRRSRTKSAPTSPASSTATSSQRATLQLKEYKDACGRTFKYDSRRNVAILSNSFIQWPKLLGPIELSSQLPVATDCAKKHLSAKFRELDHYGCVRHHDYLPGLTPGQVDRQHSKNTGLVLQRHIASRVQAHKDADSSPKETALKALHCLEYFLPVVVPYHYEAHKPSHKWCRDDKGKNYLEDLVKLVPDLCKGALQVLANDDVLVELSSPSYVLGDLHGNYRDLQFFASQFWRSGVDLCPGNILFLGDYVDRGPHSFELLVYLLCLKIVYPHKVFLLRGNHELESVCGNVEYYGLGSFREQCRQISIAAGVGNGEALWREFLTVFDWLPLAATIDGNIFCCHAGIPRHIMVDYGDEIANQDEVDEAVKRNVLDSLRHLQRPIREDSDIDGNDDCVAMDLLWADPAGERDKPNMGQYGLPPGFALNLDRGGDACVFSEEAVIKFAKLTGCDYILRAHQPPDKGIRYQAGARVITVFSSSHYCGLNNSAAMIVVSKDQLDIVTTGATVSYDRGSRKASQDLDALSEAEEESII